MINFDSIIRNETKESATLKLRTYFLEMEQQVIFYKQLANQYQSEIDQLKAQCKALQLFIKERSDDVISKL